MTYQEWMKEVDNLVWERFSMSYHDAPDLLFTRSAYDAGDTPQEFFEGEVLPTFTEEFAGYEEIASLMF